MFCVRIFYINFFLKKLIKSTKNKISLNLNFFVLELRLYVLELNILLLFHSKIVNSIFNL